MGVPPLWAATPVQVYYPPCLQLQSIGGLSQHRNVKEKERRRERRGRNVQGRERGK